VSTGPAICTPAWQWPLESKYGPGVINQDYGQWNGIPNSDQHHTGYDIYTDPDTPEVMSPAAGSVVKMSILDVRGPTCKDASPNCSDHGLGNTLIIKHNDQHHSFSQVSHLSSFDTNLEDRIKANCGPEHKDYVENGKIWVDEWNCPVGAVTVGAGDSLGKVGASGFGDPNYWPARHLHFEVKSVDAIYSKDPTDPKDGYAFGYSRAFPGLLDYLDPLHKLQTHNHLVRPYQVKIQSAGDGVSFRLGPDSKYAQALTGSAGQTFFARRKARATSSCALGWYKITKTDLQPPEGKGDPNADNYFSPTNGLLKPGLIEATWVCRGQDKNDPWVAP